MDSSREVPLLDNSGKRLHDRIVKYMSIGSVAGVICLVVMSVMCMFDDGIDYGVIQPDVELNSLIVCPTPIPIRDSVIWDIKFDLINTENDSNFCLNRGSGFDVSVFLYNQSKLLTKAFATPVSRREECIDPGNRTSLIGLVEDDSTSIQDLINEYSDPTTNGTIRLDLKIHRQDLDYVCGDAKVELPSSSSASSCGSMIGDPFACSYPPPPHCGTSCKLWFCAGPIVVLFGLLFGLLVFSVEIIGLIVYLAIKCPSCC